MICNPTFFCSQDRAATLHRRKDTLKIRSTAALRTRNHDDIPEAVGKRLQSTSKYLSKSTQNEKLLDCSHLAVLAFRRRKHYCIIRILNCVVNEGYFDPQFTVTTYAVMLLSLPRQTRRSYCGWMVSERHHNAAAWISSGLDHRNEPDQFAGRRSRPNVADPGHKKKSGSAQSRLTQWFNTAALCSASGLHFRQRKPAR